MAVTSFQDLPLANRDREWDGDAAEQARHKRRSLVRRRCGVYA